MSQKECPHCGNVLPVRAHACGCGYDFPAGSNLIGSKAARDMSAQLRSPGSSGAQSKSEPKRALKPPPEKPRKKKSRKQPLAARAAVTPKPSGGDSLSSKLISCPSCPAKISRRADRCPKCGKSPLAKCQICMNEIRANSAACPECGDPDPFNP